MTGNQDLTIAYTPDSDDAFTTFALEAGRVRLPGFLPVFRQAHIKELNQDALRGHYDVTAISSVLYPSIAEHYAILSVGTSVGRGYGPVLVGPRGSAGQDLAGKRVGVGGSTTTGAFLLRRYYPTAIAVEMAFDQIGAAVAAGTLDAGVMIHEELLFYPLLGLERIADLGALWCTESGLPLPVGLNVVRRSLGPTAMQDICAALRRSLQYALDHRAEALAWVSRFGRGAAGGVQDCFVNMFANDDTLHLPADVREGLELLLFQVVDSENGRVPNSDIIEGQKGPPIWAVHEA
jgi:1,4-dihydroxy-6-naphthoate synthase